MAPQVVVGAGRTVQAVPAPAEAAGVGHPHHAPHVGRGKPALLVVVGAGQLPTVLLQPTGLTKK